MLEGVSVSVSTRLDVTMGILEGLSHSFLSLSLSPPNQPPSPFNFHLSLSPYSSLPPCLSPPFPLQKQPWELSLLLMPSFQPTKYHCYEE